MVYTFADGTVFSADRVRNIMRIGLACTGAACSDSLEFRLGGFVTRAGFDPTPAVLRWTGQGSAPGGGRLHASRPLRGPQPVVAGGLVTCTSQPTASSASLSSPARLVPSRSLGLLGLGLLGVAARRRKAA
jgi:hypothetical protein